MIGRKHFPLKPCYDTVHRIYRVGHNTTVTNLIVIFTLSHTITTNLPHDFKLLYLSSPPYE